MANTKLKKTIEEFISTKPEVLDVIGYGSAVKTQSNSDETIKKQIDIIATCEDPVAWHIENQKNNPSEYNGFSKHFFKKMQNFGTDIQYISDIRHNDHIFKIGVISKENFIKDLVSWNNFYMAGRMQKPVMLVRSDEEIEKAIKKDRLNALRTALILTEKKSITEEELLTLICSLSYMGDIRMKFKFENPNKVNNIVQGEFEEIRKIYSELNEDLYFVNSSGILMPNKNKLLREIEELPEELLKYLRGNQIDLSSLKISEVDKLAHLIRKYIEKTNFKSSISQPMKSALINNFSNSQEYLKEKRKKYIINK